MSQCYYTNLIRASDCIGDSLQTINDNFTKLDQNLCDVPQVLPGNGTAIQNNLTEQERYTTSIHTTNSIVYKTAFESLNVASLQNLALGDGTTVQTTLFPYEGVVGGPKPYATFTTTTLANSLPKVTLYWLASGVDNTTVVATNSGASVSNKGSIWFNDSVTALKQVGNLLYIGGKFTEVGGTDCRKFCSIDLTGGSVHSTLSAVGSLSSTPFGALDLGTVGTVNAIEVGTVGVSNVIAIGGSFQSALKGRGLSILAGTQNFPFYVNGTVNALALSGDQLVVGGDFNYINYGASSASVESGRRVLCRGFVRVDLTTLIAVGNGDQAMTPLCPIFSGKVLINTLTTKDNILYAGGVFQIKSGEQIVCQNACAMRIDGSRVQTWNPILDGPVHTLVVDDQTLISGNGVHLFIGGQFSRYYTNSTFYLTPRPVNSDSEVFNACVVRIDQFYNLNNSWKPRFNGPVSKIALNDNLSSGSVYCYGKFSAVNDESCSFVCNVSKQAGAALNKFWKPSLETPPDFISNALLHDGHVVTVGGNFSKVNNTIRYHLARITDIDNTTYPVPSLSSINWELGAQVGGFGLPFQITSNTPMVSSISYPYSFGILNETTFPQILPTFNGLSEGQLVRFFVRRTGNNGTNDDSLKVSANVVGYKIDFNN